MKTFAAICALSCLILGACGQEIEPGRSAGEPPVIEGLGLLTLSPTPESPALELVGTVESRDRAVISARIDGRLTRFAAREGEEVRSGALLANIEENTAEERLREAEAGLVEAGGRLAAAEARFALAEKTFARYRQLSRQEAVTPQEFDRVTAELETEQQDLEAARGSLRRAEALRDGARTFFSYTRVTAPYGARVVRLEAEEGSTVMPGTALLVLDRLGVWRVRADFPESLAGEVAVGEVYSVDIPALKQTLSGKVAEIVPAADPRSRSFQVKMELAGGSGLAAGMFARVRVSGSGPGVLLIPPGAVVTRGQLTGVFVVEQGILRYRLVKTGRQTEGGIEILSGLSAGETLVVKGVGSARNGARAQEVSDAR